MTRFKSGKLQCWFNLSYSSWLTLPRVFMEAMPIEWQDKITDLLNEWDETWIWPNIGSRVQITEGNKLIKTPGWIINYRHPDCQKIEEMRTREHWEGEMIPKSKTQARRLAIQTRKDGKKISNKFWVFSTITDRLGILLSIKHYFCIRLCWDDLDEFINLLQRAKKERRDMK